jgi:hypothetical protein
MGDGRDLEETREEIRLSNMIGLAPEIEYEPINTREVIIHATIDTDSDLWKAIFEMYKNGEKYTSQVHQIAEASEFEIIEKEEDRGDINF